MKILYVTARYPLGSGEEFLAAEIRALQRHGAEVIVHPTRSRPHELRAASGPGGVTLTGLPSIGMGCVLLALVHLLGNLPALAHLVGAFVRSPRHLLKNLVVLPSGLLLGLWCKRNQPDHIHAHWLTTSGTVAYIASYISDIPFSITAHRGDIVNGNLARAKADATSFIRFISENGRGLFKEANGFMAERSVVIPMGVDVDGGRPCSAPASDAMVRIVVPASLRPVKGHRYLMEALATPAWLRSCIQVDVIGDGPLRQSLQAQINELGLDRCVTLIGHMPHEELMARYESGLYGLVVLGSVDMGGGIHEGVPVSLMEAMAHGVVPVATRTGGIGELVTDGHDGVLVPHSDPPALSSAIALLVRDTQLRCAMSVLAKERVRSSFNADLSAARLLDSFNGDGTHLVSHPPPPEGV